MQGINEDRIIRVSVDQMQSAAQVLMRQTSMLNWKQLTDNAKAGYFQVVVQMLSCLGYEAVVVYSETSLDDSVLVKGSNVTSNIRQTPEERSETS